MTVPERLKVPYEFGETLQIRLEAQCTQTLMRGSPASRQQGSVESDGPAPLRQLKGSLLVCSLLGPNTLKKPTVATPWKNPTCDHTDHH